MLLGAADAAPGWKMQLTPALERSRCSAINPVWVLLPLSATWPAPHSRQLLPESAATTALYRPTGQLSQKSSLWALYLPAGQASQ